MNKLSLFFSYFGQYKLNHLYFTLLFEFIDVENVDFEHKNVKTRFYEIIKNNFKNVE